MTKFTEAEKADFAARVRPVYDRRARAIEAFKGHLVERGLTEAEAGEVFAFFVRNRLVKYDGDRFTVKHGAYLDRPVLRRAVALAAEGK